MKKYFEKLCYIMLIVTLLFPMFIINSNAVVSNEEKAKS